MTVAQQGFEKFIFGRFFQNALQFTVILDGPCFCQSLGMTFYQDNFPP
jgi:hypothetical protein